MTDYSTVLSNWLNSTPNPNYDCTNSNGTGGTTLFFTQMTEPHDVACWSAVNPTQTQEGLVYNFNPGDVMIITSGTNAAIIGYPGTTFAGTDINQSNPLSNVLQYTGNPNNGTIAWAIGYIPYILANFQAFTIGAVWGFTSFMGDSNSNTFNAPHFVQCPTSSGKGTGMYPPPLASINGGTLVAPVPSTTTVATQCTSSGSKTNWGLIILIAVIIIVALIILGLLITFALSRKKSEKESNQITKTTKHTRTRVTTEKSE